MGALDSQVSILQGTDIEQGLQFNTIGEQVARSLSIDWDFVPGTNVRTYATLFPTITGLNNIRYRLRDGVPAPVNFGTLGANIRAETTLVPGGPTAVFLDSGTFVKPTGPDSIQLTAEGILGQSNNSGGTVEVGIIPDNDTQILGFSSLRGGYSNQPAVEALITQYRVDFDRFTTANVRLTCAMHYQNFNFSLGTLSMRQGGTYNVVDGAVIASNAAIPINFNQFISLSVDIARPVGFDTIKITYNGVFIQNVNAPALWIQEV